ncbi:TPA: hypothetical protein ACH3X3_008557 [Trebouxia sp. C0006]
MAQLKTYSRKSKLVDAQDGAYKSSQESFFDSPDDPYFFDSQNSTLEAPQISDDSHPHPPICLPASSSKSSQTQLQPEKKPPVASLTSTVAKVTAQPKPVLSRPLSRLSKSSCQGTKPKPSHSQPTKPKRSLTSASSLEGPVAKKACLKRHSGSSSSHGRSSGSKIAADKQTSAPATTVLEAQESGEHTQIVDDIVYAIDGLGRASSRNSWQDGASTLAEICNTRRGRQAFRIEGLFKEAMTAALQLPLHDDCTTALAFSAMLLSFASGDVANRALLATTEAVQLAGQLIQVHLSLQSCTAAQAKLAKLFRNGVMSLVVARHPQPSPSLVITAALSTALSPDKSSLAGEKLKENLRTEGVLEQLVYAAQRHAMQEGEPVAMSSQTDANDRPPSAFNQCLTVLEHASFACPANEQHLVGLHMESGSTRPSLSPANSEPKAGQLADSACRQPFPDWLVQSIQHMQSTSTPDPDGDNQPDWSCIQSALSVLINMSHNNTAGCEAVVAAGGLQMATDIISNSMLRHDMCDAATDGSVTPRRALAHTRQHVLTDVGPITAALGLLINLVENCSDTRQQLKAMKLQVCSLGADVPQLLCRLMQVSASSRRSSMSPSPHHSGGEVTEQQLADHENDGAASIVEVYAALLYGFLLADDSALQAVAVSTLGSLQPIISSIKKCLSFYVDAGAITSQNEDSLRKLLASLPNSSSCSIQS